MPVYHSFFDIDSLEYEPVYIPAIPIFYGLFEDNDPNGRLISVANHNNDIGEFWEYSTTRGTCRSTLRTRRTSWA